MFVQSSQLCADVSEGMRRGRMATALRERIGCRMIMKWLGEMKFWVKRTVGEATTSAKCCLCSWKERNGRVLRMC